MELKYIVRPKLNVPLTGNLDYTILVSFPANGAFLRKHYRPTGPQKEPFKGLKQRRWEPDRYGAEPRRE